MALCHNGTLGRLESLCCSMQLTFGQYVANKMGMMKITKDVEDGSGGEDDNGFDDDGDDGDHDDE